LSRVDILLPAYNGAKFIEAQIESILQQSYTDIRLIIRDDGSQDNTVELINKFVQCDSRVFFIQNEGINLGLVKSIEFMLGISTAPLIMFSDQDDVWFHEKVSLFVTRALSMNQDSQLLIHSDCYITKKDLTIVRKFMGSKPLNYGLKRCLFHFYVQGSSTMINRVLKDECLPFPDTVYLHDRYFHVMSELSGFRSYINLPTMYYRQHEVNLVGGKSFFEKLLKNVFFWKYKFYLEKDRVLIMSILEKKCSDKLLVDAYGCITNDYINRFRKISIILRNRIPLRVKEWFLLIIRN
jgi:rhamnosyltransferase